MIICIEGIDGVGKTTIVNLLSAGLNRKYKIKTIREPGGTFIGELSRFLLEKGNISSAVSRMLLYMLARSENVEHINDNNIYIFDRFSPSTIAYQGVYVTDHEKIYELEKIVRQDIVPDYTFYLFNDAEVCVEREMKRDKIVLPEFVRKQKAGHYSVLLDSYDRAFSILNWPNVYRIKTDQEPIKIAKQIYEIIKGDLKKYERKTR